MSVNSSPPGQNSRHFADDIFRCVFVNEKFYILIEISLKFVPKGPINNIPALVQIMAWRWIGDKPLFEPMLPDSLTHICGTRGRWVNGLWSSVAMRQHKSVSTLAQVLACCLRAPSHYLDQYWFIINMALWHSPEEDNFTQNVQDTNL